MNRTELLALEEKMIKAGMHALWTGENFVVAFDQEGPINVASSDSLHILAYLDARHNSFQTIAKKIENSSQPLETKAGYRSVSKDLIPIMKNQYHGGSTVWVFEQAVIHYGAQKFGLSRAKEVSSRVRKYLNTAPEILKIGTSGKISKEGSDPQLWTIAAKHYFDQKITPVVL